MLVGYGYAPGRALALLALALGADWAFFRDYQPPPVNPAAHPSFNAAIYTANLLTPAPGLGTQVTGTPTGPGSRWQPACTPWGGCWPSPVIAAITRAVSGIRG